MRVLRPGDHGDHYALLPGEADECIDLALPALEQSLFTVFGAQQEAIKIAEAIVDHADNLAHFSHDDHYFRHSARLCLSILPLSCLLHLYLLSLKYKKLCIEGVMQ